MEVSAAGDFCRSPLAWVLLLALHQLVKLPRSRAAPWLDPESCLGRFLCQCSGFEGVLAVEVLSLPSARLELSFTLGIDNPPVIQGSC